MTTAEHLAQLEANDHVRLSSTGSWLDAEATEADR